MCSVLVQPLSNSVAPGHTGVILLVLCFIDSSAMLHYAEHGSGDGLRSVP